MATVEEVIKRELQKWAEENSEEAIAGKVRGMLDACRDELIVKAAGFKRSFGEWEVNTYNHRKSALADYLNTKAQEAVTAWISENIQNFPVLTDKLRKAFIKGYKETYTDELYRALRRFAEDKAQEDAEMLVNEYLSEHGLPNQSTDVKLSKKVADDYQDLSDEDEEAEALEEWLDEDEE